MCSSDLSSGLARQMRPGAGQSRQSILVLGQLHLQSALARMRVARKDVQYQGCTIQDLDVLSQFLLQLALLSRRQLVIEYDNVEAKVIMQVP